MRFQPASSPSVPAPRPSSARSSFARRSLARHALIGSALGAALLASCGGGGGGGGGEVPAGPPPAPGTFSYPAGFDPSPAGFFVDANEKGDANDPRIVNVAWGRLVDVFDTDAVTGVNSLQHRDFVVGEDIRTDGVDFVLDINPVTEQATLILLHEAGTPGYDAAFAKLELNLGPIQPKGLGVGELPPFSFMPRNAALVLTFSDLLDHDTVDDMTIQVRTGYPPESPFEARILVDPNHGGLVSTPAGKEFRSSRVILDTTVSELESQSGTTAPVNSIGLPPSITTAQPNVAIRIPTKQDPPSGQFATLQNFSGHNLATSNHGPVDFTSGSVDVVRALRSGGDEAITGDSNNGFLLDLNAPRILGSQPISLLTVNPDGTAGPDSFVTDIQFASIECAQAPAPGDVIELAGGIFAEVTLPAAPPSNGIVNDVRVRLLSGQASDFIVGQGLLNTVFAQGDVPECFVIFSPTPTGFPNEGVAPNSQVGLRFSEPMDPGSITAFDSFLITREPLIGSLNDIVVGDIVPSPDLREFRFVPLLPFNHSTGSAEEFFVNLASGETGITDLAGNELLDGLPQTSFTLEPTAGDERNGSIVLRFNAVDEDGNGFPEMRGQLLYDLGQGVIRPRPVSRFAATADRTQAVPSLMVPFPSGVQTPLSSLGSRLMTVYRYLDVGFTATDESTHNVDIEALNWSPIGGQIIFDFYDQFEIRLAHSKYLPEEYVNPTSLLPTNPNSGLKVSAFEDNVLEDPLNILKVVHPRAKGYSVNPLNLFQTVTGTVMMPYPLNQDGDIANYEYYTWRDTALQGLGGQSSKGIDPQIMETAGLIPPGTFGQIAKAGFVPTIGLPILMEYKCFPDDQALGLNSFDISLAINSSARPNFRVFSTGGFNTSGTAVVKNPDLETSPSGGFNPSTVPPGKTTPGQDNSFYIGQLDIVTRVSRAHSIFLNADDDPSPDYLDPVLEPLAEEQPVGTQIVLAYRGAFAVMTTEDGSPHLNAMDLDFYGDQSDKPSGMPPTTSGVAGDPQFKNNGVDFPPLPGNPPGEVEDETWKNDIDEIDGLQFVQLRVTFISNAESNLSPELSAIGIAFLKGN